MSEEELRDKIHSGDEKTFEWLFHTYYLSLKSFCRKFVERDDIAEDIIQDVFYQIITKHKQIKIDISVKAYLFGCVRNSCLNYFRSLKSRRTLSEDISELEIRELLLDNSLDIILEIQQKDLKKQLSDAISALPVQCKKVFLYSRKYKLKNKEIAERLGISVKTVEKHLSVAFNTLRDKLKYLIILLGYFS